MNAAMPTAAQAGLASCRVCGLLCRVAGAQAVGRGHCPRCGVPLASRFPYSVQRTWALVIAAAMCYVPANLLPVLTMNEPGASDPNTIMGGVISLYTTGSWHLALIVLVASIIIPLGKLLALGYLLVVVQRGAAMGNSGGRRDRTRLFRTIEFIGRWSMLDVFVVTFGAALVQAEPVMWAQVGPGMPYFGAVVILTMFAAMSFDPRLMWDAGDARDPRDPRDVGDAGDAGGGRVHG